MTITVKGLIIKETNVGEGDKIITILTPDLGKIQAGANGARSFKSKFIAGCQLFCYSTFVLSKKKDWYRVTSAEPEEIFYGLRTDLEKLSLATYFCDVLCEVSSDGHDSEEALRLALNALYIITKSDNLPLIKAVFELRLMSISGFAPMLDSCVRCGETEGCEAFSAGDGGVLCDGCADSGFVSSGTLSAMRHIISCDAKKLFSFEVSDGVQSELSSIAESYMLYNVGRDFRSLKYYLTIRKNMI